MGKLIQAIISVAVFAVLFTFSAALLVVVVPVLIAVVAYFWWKTKKAHQRWREQQATYQSSPYQDSAPAQGEILEGEVIREVSDPSVRRLHS